MTIHAGPHDFTASARSPRPASARERELDLREDLRAKREPFSKIMATVASLADDEVLHLRTIFEPVPLYAVLGKRGFAHEAERHAEDDWSIRFWRGAPDEHQRDSESAPEPASTPEAAPDADAAAGVETWLDVRGLEPPEPMRRTLAALERLPAGHTLVQVNLRVPQFLLPLLAERGFAFAVDESRSDRVLVRIRARS